MMTIRAAALLLAIASPALAQGTSGNLLSNSNFVLWSHGAPTHSGQGPDGWYIGPGANGAVTVWPAPQGDTNKWLAIRWDTLPSYDPSPNHLSTSDLESGYWGMAPVLAGHQVTLRFYAWASVGSLYVIPMVWVNWSNGDYSLLQCPAVRVENMLKPVVCSVQLPEQGSHIIDEWNYVGVGTFFLPDTPGTTVVLMNYVLTTP